MLASVGDDLELSNYFPFWDWVSYGLLLVDAKGKLLEANRWIINDLGYCPTTIRKQLFFQINPHYSLLDWRKLWGQLENGATHLDQPSQFMTKQGVIFPIRISYKLSSLQNQKVCCCLITHAQKDEPTEELLELISSKSQLGIWQMDLRNPGIQLNQVAQRSLGIAEPGGKVQVRKLWKTLVKLGTRSQSEKIRQVLAEATKKQKPFTLHLELNTRTKNVLTLSGYPKIRLGRVIALYGFLQQPTGQEALLQETAVYRQLLDQSQDMIFCANQKADLLFLNATLQQVLKTIHPISVSQVLSDLTPVAWEKYWKAWQQGKKLRFQHKLINKGGKQISVNVLVKHFSYQDISYAACYLVIDQPKDAERGASHLLNPSTQSALKLKAAQAEIQRLKAQLSVEKIHLEEEVKTSHNFQQIISKSKKYKQVMRHVAQVATTTSTVLILGETGTGKELLARAIHSLSDRSARSMVKVNCAALPENLIESELFGHEKGAFTGAIQSRTGRFELAHQGTIFLDEIGELSLEVQAKLLRVLQEGEFERLGGSETHTVDVRVIAATNRKLEELVKKKEFRSDLYYRLNVFPIYNIPLRERKEDILPLVKHFIQKFNRKNRREIKEISPMDLERLMTYEFPGNIRELENIVERAVILSKGSTLNLEAVFPALLQRQSPRERFPTLEEIQKHHILEALSRSNWKVTGRSSAAELLRINGKTLVSKMRKLGIRRFDS